MLQMKVSTFVKAIGIPALSELGYMNTATKQIRWSNNMLPSGIQGLGMGLPDLRSKNKRKQKAAPKESHASETLNKLIEQTRETVKGLESIAGLKASSVDGLGLRDDKMMEDLVKQFEELAKSQVSPAEVIFDSQGLTKEAQKALNKYSLIGSVATQMTPTQPATDFVDSFEVHNFIKMKGYFKGSSNVWDHVLDGVVHQEIALCALGGLTNHLSRLKLDDTLLNGSILPYEVYRGCLRMDGQTMANLEIFSNSEDGGTSDLTRE